MKTKCQSNTHDTNPSNFSLFYHTKCNGYDIQLIPSYQMQWHHPKPTITGHLKISKRSYNTLPLVQQCQYNWTNNMNLNHSLTPINSMTCKCPQSNYFTFEQGLPINGSDQPQHHGQPLHWFDMHYVMTSNASKFSLPHQSWWLKITTQCSQPYHTVRTISLMTISTCNHSTSSLAIGTHLQPYMRPCNHCGHTQWYAPGSPRHQCCTDISPCLTPLG